MTWWRWLALTTLLAIVVTGAMVAATALAISFALAERPASFSDRTAGRTGPDRISRSWRAGPKRGPSARTDGGAREIRLSRHPEYSSPCNANFVAGGVKLLPL